MLVFLILYVKFVPLPYAKSCLIEKLIIVYFREVIRQVQAAVDPCRDRPLFPRLVSYKENLKPG